MPANENLASRQYLDRAFDKTTDTHRVTLATSTSSGLALESGGNLDTIAGDTTSLDAKQPALGTAAMAASSPVTIATDDTVSVSIGTTSDAAVDSDTTGTVIGFLRGIVKIFADVWDSTSNLVKVQEQSPLPSEYDDVVNLVTASDIGAVDNTWVDQGSEIDCRTRTKLGIWVKLAVNDSTGNQIQFLSKHTSAGADEYVLDTSSSYQKTLGDSDIKVFYEFDVATKPYVQIQTKATDVDTGGGTEGTVTIDITKRWI